MQPRKPSLNVLPEPEFTGSSLMKPAGTLKQTLERLQGGFQFTAGAEMVSKEIESFLSFPDETLIGVDAKFEPCEHGMHLPYRCPEPPAGGREDEPGDSCSCKRCLAARISAWLASVQRANWCPCESHVF